MKTELSSYQIDVLLAVFSSDNLRPSVWDTCEPHPMSILRQDKVTLDDVLSVMPKSVRCTGDSKSTYRLEMTRLDDEWLVSYSNEESEFVPFIREELIDALFCVLVDIRIHEFIPAL